jgi:plasmid stabilization system protein ParE
MSVFLTEPAEQYLRGIYMYYESNISATMAQKIKEQIFTRIESLENFAERGRIEPHLKIFKQKHRFVLQGNYKIIYRIENDHVYVTDIFDTRQNPEKIIKRR